MAPRSLFLAVPVVFSLSGTQPLQAAAAGDLEKSLQRPEMLPFLPFLWKNEGLLFTDILLQKLLLPFGLTSPYTNLFLTDAIRTIANDLDFSDDSSRRLRGRRLQASESPRETIRAFTKSLHGALGGNVFDLGFADQLIDELPSSVSEQLASVTEAFGSEILRILADAENPASVIIQQLVAPFEGDGIPFLVGAETSDDTSYAPRALQEVESLATPSTGPNDDDQKDTAAAALMKMIEAALGDFNTSSGASSAEPLELSSAQENLSARAAVVGVAHEIGQEFGVAELYANLAGAFCDEFLIPSGLVKEVAALILKAKAAMGEGDLSMLNPVSLLVGIIGSKTGDDVDLQDLLAFAAEIGRALGSEKFYVSLAKSFFCTFLVPFKLDKVVTELLLEKKEALLKAAAVKAFLLTKTSAKAFAAALLTPKALAALALKSSDLLKLPLLMGGGLDKFVLGGVDKFDLPKIPILLGGIKFLYPEACLKILAHALQIGEKFGKGLLYMAVSKAVVHTVLDPLGLTEVVASLFAAKFEKTGGGSWPFSGPARTVTIIQGESADKASKESILAIARHAGDVTGNGDLYASLMSFFVDNVLDPLGLTQSVADAVHDGVATMSTAGANVSLTDIIENLVVAVYTS
ncbi:hypothetical protein BESB_073020 [Besnoitia besnoiti]|uniref:Uncharacterized protein n=1 Tax=Besnoitia besnoiti TaxID=94643 RepID=A0A2A9MFJ7_BESBE|nr:uncharacterized protein BESB_073020 [Besnoitia besnoiti]PFH34150.1 hypothetical protein BESB_073020 [Besnoitia besnoiti]